jgi:hypothetical protein
MAWLELHAEVLELMTSMSSEYDISETAHAYKKRMAAYARDAYHGRVSRGACCRCGRRADASKVFCAAHLPVRTIAQRKAVNLYRNALARARKSAGMCVRCGLNSMGTYYCQRHANEHNERRRRRREGARR